MPPSNILRTLGAGVLTWGADLMARGAGALGWPSGTRYKERGDQHWIFPGRPDRETGTDVAAVPAIWAAVTLVSQLLARLPHVAGRWVDGYWQPDPDHPVSRLLADPDPGRMDPQQWRGYYYRGLVAGGNGYAIIHRDLRMRPVQLELAEAARAEWVGRGGERTRQYHLYPLTTFRGHLVTQQERATRWPASEVLAVHGPGFDGLASPSPIEAAGRAHVEVLGRAVQHQLQHLKGVQLKNAIETAWEMQGLGDADRGRLYTDLREQWTGAQAAGKVPILPPGFRLVHPQTSPADLQIVELLKWGVEDIARIFGVPPMELFSNQGETSGRTIEAQNAWLERRTLSGHVTRIEAQYTQRLFTREARTRGWAVRLPLERALLGSLSEVAKSVELLVTRGGLLTVNEGRGLMGYPPRTDGDRLLPPKGSPAPVRLEED